MAAGRPTWQGHLRLSLVTCPVALYTATDSQSDVRFNMLHKTTHNRIRMVPTDPDLGPVERADIVKGYGGTVKVLGLVENSSTTAIVENIRKN